MRKITIFVLFYLCFLIVPNSIFAGGNKDRCDLTIENKTGTKITQIIFGESDSNKKQQIVKVKMDPYTSTKITIKKAVLYDVTLVNTDGREYVRKGQSWNNDASIIVFEPECDLTIINRTDTRITQIIIEESNSNERPQNFYKNMNNNASTVIPIKKNVFYDITLVNTNGRKYVKNRQSWNNDVSSIVFEGECDLTIVNKTGKQITQIIIGEAESDMEQIFNRNVNNNASTVITIKKNVLYGIILVSTDERQYAKKRQAWNDDTSITTYELRDIVDKNVWDKALRVILWPFYL